MGRHTHDRVAAKILANFERFGIEDKVKFVTTDGAGEYVAAFRYFGDDYESMFMYDDDDDVDSVCVANANANANDAATDFQQAGPSSASAPPPAPVTAVAAATVSISNAKSSTEAEAMAMNDEDYDVHAYINNHDQQTSNSSKKNNDSFTVHDSESEFRDPRILGKMNRVDCSAHKADKLASIDAVTAVDDDVEYRAIHNRVFDKLHKIWGLKPSRVSAEIFQKITGKSLIGPHNIRWLKMHEAVS